MTAKAKEAKPPKEKYKQSQTIEINRTQIKFAPYNPRKENPKVIVKLKANFKKIGFLGGIVWNETTGNLVSGHKRTQALDIIHGYDGTKETDYKIKVEKVTLNDKEEKEQNIFFNSASAQGEFDLDILRDLVPDLDYQAAGLEDYDLNIIGISQHETTDVVDEDISEIQQVNDAIKKKEAVIKTKQNFKDKLKEEWEGDPYFTVTFDNYKAKSDFLERLGLDADERFVKGEIMDKKVEIVGQF